MTLPEKQAEIPPHGHCPLGCEHPQPFDALGSEYCGRCWHVDGVMTEMEPCTPERCGNEFS